MNATLVARPPMTTAGVEPAGASRPTPTDSGRIISATRPPRGLVPLVDAGTNAPLLNWNLAAAPILGHATVEEVRFADEVGHEPVDRALVDLARRPDLADPAAGHDGDPRRHRQGLLLVVRDEHERRADLAVDARQLDLHLLAELEVERPERLVEEQHGRSLGERARQRDTLRLAARQLRRVAVAVLRQADQLEVLRDALTDLAVRQALHPQAERDVVGDGHVREQRVVLEDRVDVALVRGQVVDPPALDAQLARTSAG